MDDTRNDQHADHEPDLLEKLDPEIGRVDLTGGLQRRIGKDLVVDQRGGEVGADDTEGRQQDEEHKDHQRLRDVVFEQPEQTEGQRCLGEAFRADLAGGVGVARAAFGTEELRLFADGAVFFFVVAVGRAVQILGEDLEGGRAADRGVGQLVQNTVIADGDQTAGGDHLVDLDLAQLRKRTRRKIRNVEHGLHALFVFVAHNVLNTGHYVKIPVVKGHDLIDKVLLQIHVALDVSDDLIDIHTAFCKPQRDVGRNFLLLFLFQTRFTSQFFSAPNRAKPPKK